VQNAQIAAGVVGGSEGSRHVADVIVGGWHEKRRSVQRHVRVLPPRDNIVICPAGVREAGMSQMSLLVVGIG